MSTTTTKAKNPHRIRAKAALDNAGLTLEECALDSVVPACCDAVI